MFQLPDCNLALYPGEIEIDEKGNIINTCGVWISENKIKCSGCRNFKTGYNPTKLKKEGVQVFTITAELHEVGLTTMQTPFGHEVPVYDMERTICDLLRSRNHMEIQTFQGALKAYARRKDKNLRTLMRYANLFRVEKILRQYLEVLL